MQRKEPRFGISLLELIVVIAILAVLIAILLPAVQNVRVAAVRLKSQNKIRQINLATHSFASANSERLPYFPDKYDPSDSLDTSPMYSALRFIDGYNGYETVSSAIKDQYRDAIHQSPADPSYAAFPDLSGNTSYVGSVLFFRKGVTMVNVAPDGLSNSMTWTEQYARCGRASFFVNLSRPCERLVISGWTAWDPHNRHTFADRECGQVYPVTINGVTTPTSSGINPPTMLFQVAPKPADCNLAVPATPHQAGIFAAMGDGSVRTISPRVSIPTFWSLVTPDGGETPSDW